MGKTFPRLFEPLRIRGCTLKNRIMSTGHDTTLPVDGTVNEALVAYKRRGRGVESASSCCRYRACTKRRAIPTTC